MDSTAGVMVTSNGCGGAVDIAAWAFDPDEIFCNFRVVGIMLYELDFEVCSCSTNSSSRANSKILANLHLHRFYYQSKVVMTLDRDSSPLFVPPSIRGTRKFHT